MDLEEKNFKLDKNGEVVDTFKDMIDALYPKKTRPIVKSAKCGAELIWGRFAHNQETCWECFAQTTRDIIDETKREDHKAHISYLMACVAEIFGYRW